MWSRSRRVYCFVQWNLFAYRDMHQQDFETATCNFAKQRENLLCAWASENSRGCNSTCVHIRIVASGRTRWHFGGNSQHFGSVGCLSGPLLIHEKSVRRRHPTNDFRSLSVPPFPRPLCFCGVSVCGLGVAFDWCGRVWALCLGWVFLAVVAGSVLAGCVLAGRVVQLCVWAGRVWALFFWLGGLGVCVCGSVVCVLGALGCAWAGCVSVRCVSFCKCSSLFVVFILLFICLVAVFFRIPIVSFFFLVTWNVQFFIMCVPSFFLVGSLHQFFTRRNTRVKGALADWCEDLAQRTIVHSPLRTGKPVEKVYNDSESQVPIRGRIELCQITNLEIWGFRKFGAASRREIRKSSWTLSTTESLWWRWFFCNVEWGQLFFFWKHFRRSYVRTWLNKLMSIMYVSSKWQQIPAERYFRGDVKIGLVLEVKVTKYFDRDVKELIEESKKFFHYEEASSNT